MKKKAKVTAKVTAKGMCEGKHIVFEVLRYGGGLDKNGDWQNGKLEFTKDGINCKNLPRSEDGYLTESAREAYGFFRKIQDCVVKRYLKTLGSPFYAIRVPPNTIEAYWLAFNYGDGFDEVPEITVEGKIDTLGLPFSDEDTSHVVF